MSVSPILRVASDICDLRPIFVKYWSSSEEYWERISTWSNGRVQAIRYTDPKEFDNSYGEACYVGKDHHPVTEMLDVTYGSSAWRSNMDLRPLIPITADDRAEADRILKKLPKPFTTLCAPMRWLLHEPQRMIDITNRMREHGPVLVTDPYRTLHEVVGASDRISSEDTNIMMSRCGVLAAVIDRSSLFVGTDCGHVQVALSTNTPVIGLYSFVRPEARLTPGRQAFTRGIGAPDYSCPLLPCGGIHQGGVRPYFPNGKGPAADLGIACSFNERPLACCHDFPWESATRVITDFLEGSGNFDPV